jgi:hypothetical protein
MNLDGEESGKVGLVLLVIFEGGEVDAIDVDLDTIATAFDKVVVPVIEPRKTSERGGVRKGEDVAFSIRRDFGERSAFGDEAASVLVIDSAEPKLAVVEVALVSGGVSRTRPFWSGFGCLN